MTEVDVDFIVLQFLLILRQGLCVYLCGEGDGRTRTVGRWDFPRRMVNMDIYGDYLILNIFIEVC